MMPPEDVARRLAEELSQSPALGARELQRAAEDAFDRYLIRNRPELLAEFRRRFDPAFRAAEAKQDRPEIAKRKDPRDGNA